MLKTDVAEAIWKLSQSSHCRDSALSVFVWTAFRLANGKCFKSLLEKLVGEQASDSKIDGCGLYEDRICSESMYNRELLSLLTHIESFFFSSSLLFSLFS